MRALLLTDNRGAPQGWCQDGMYMATWSILLQFFMVLLIPLCTYFMEGKATHPELDEDGNVRAAQLPFLGLTWPIYMDVVRQ